MSFTNTLLLHIDPRQKIDTKFLIKLLLNAKKRSKINVGVSIYGENDIESDVYEVCDVVQLPVSVLDNTLLNSGFIQRLKSKNIQVHARSIFLQGTLLNNPKKFERQSSLSISIDRKASTIFNGKKLFTFASLFEFRNKE